MEMAVLALYKQKNLPYLQQVIFLLVPKGGLEPPQAYTH